MSFVLTQSPPWHWSTALSSDTAETPSAFLSVQMPVMRIRTGRNGQFRRIWLIVSACIRTIPRSRWMNGYSATGKGEKNYVRKVLCRWGNSQSPPRHSSVLLSSISAAYMHSFSPHSQIPCDPSWYSGFRVLNKYMCGHFTTLFTEERWLIWMYDEESGKYDIYITCLSFNLI